MGAILHLLMPGMNKSLRGKKREITLGGQRWATPRASSADKESGSEVQFRTKKLLCDSTK